MPEIPSKPMVRSLNSLIRTGEICRSLRSKKLFYQSEEDASDIANSGPFWCARSQSLIGIDGKIAGHEECRPGRGCCETT
ncbi:MAG TPA: hypothetical protein VMH00_17545 [Candidatus Limnocylindrales bacterium]|nr:hypothetical protein [Candidatus Limnocylindrales bacterium]